MKSLGTLISIHKGKKLYQIIYTIPIVILLLMCYPIGKVILNTSADNRFMLYVLLGMNTLLIVILLIFMRRSRPSFYFELFENGVRLVYNNVKKEPKEILFEDISNYWQYRLPLNNQYPNILVFEYNKKDLVGINTKFNASSAFIKKFIERFGEIHLSILKEAISNGGRIDFFLLPSTTPQTILAEDAFLPFIKNLTFSKISLDKFTLFDGEKAESISSISSAKINPVTRALTIFSTSGAVVFEYEYDLVSKPDLLLQMINFLTEKKTVIS
ncbi:hypothetical protein [Rhizosphaericola mali]|uniref:Uncharacterized protein n=1 Tax=Rhizosphaericola mali TaxID=2545455 RepID=A0A5P2G741_9BACT|nr:hypothetical protein [Rhizosphaericola mali]QES90518.1 hypothetical protein E0W69_018265 [Rhizosphaericola mali]